MGKITVTHYLNKRLKPSIIKGVIEYPVYVRVSYGRKNERIKSNWLIHTCSEDDFNNDRDIEALKKYESEIIRDIIEAADNQQFNLSARLGHSIEHIPEIFQNWMFDRHEIKNQIIHYISVKSDLSKSILFPYFREELHSSQWKELCEKEIFNKSTQEKVMYLALLLEFEEQRYPPLPDHVFGYRAGCVFVFHEWKNKNKEVEFLKFAKRKNILPRNRLHEITQQFNSNLLEHNEFDIICERSDPNIR